MLPRFSIGFLICKVYFVVSLTVSLFFCGSFSFLACLCFLRFLQISLPLCFCWLLQRFARSWVSKFVWFPCCLKFPCYPLVPMGGLSLLVLLSCWHVLIPWFSQLCLVVLSVLSAGLLQLYLVFKVLKFPVQAYFTGFLASLASNISTCFLGYFRTSQVARRKI